MPTMVESATLEVLQRHLQCCPADRSARAMLADLLDDCGEEFAASVHRHLAWGTMEKSVMLDVLQRHLQRCPDDRSARAVLADLLDDAGERFMASVHRHLAWKTMEQMADQRYLAFNHGTASGVAVYVPGVGTLPGETEVVDWSRYERVRGAEIADERWFRIHTLNGNAERIWYVANDTAQNYSIWEEESTGEPIGWLIASAAAWTRRVPVFTFHEAGIIESEIG